MAADRNVERGKLPESVGWIMVLSGKQTQRLVVVGCRLFKVLMSLSRMLFPVVPVLYLRLIILVGLLINECLHELNLCGTEVISI